MLRGERSWGLWRQRLREVRKRALPPMSLSFGLRPVPLQFVHTHWPEDGGRAQSW